MNASRTTMVALLAALVTGCGPDAFLKHLHQLKADTKKDYKAENVKAAALPLFSDSQALTHRLPDQIRSLPIFSDGPTNIIVSYPLGNTNILSFSVGSGFGTWGMVVCRYDGDQRQLTNDAWFRPRLTPWEHGVYFYSEFR
jgi:hypothetical protein